ncbi:MAG: four helix bundle protein, partial [Verrucomicrobia bacterium]|nr:four helix bundle protein [Verrucomicrobiota bacterium]
NVMKRFDHEKLEVYRSAIRFVAWLSELMKKVKLDHHIVPLAESFKQLDRASISIALNIAEGNGRRQMKQRIRFLDDARGSATECAAGLDVLVAKGVLENKDIDKGKEL